MIPEERTWAALHQAVWWDNEKAVNWLLYECKSCDPLVLTKQNPDHGAGLTPIDVASDPSRPRPAIKQFLQGFTEEMRRERFGTDAPYFISAKDGKRMDRGPTTSAAGTGQLQEKLPSQQSESTRAFQ